MGGESCDLLRLRIQSLDPLVAEIEEEVFAQIYARELRGFRLVERATGNGTAEVVAIAMSIGE